MKKRTLVFGLGINFAVTGIIAGNILVAVVGALLLVIVNLYEYFQSKTIVTLVVGFFANMTIALLPALFVSNSWHTAVYLAAIIGCVYIWGFVHFIAKHSNEG